jgi:hypothetical protein
MDESVLRRGIILATATKNKEKSTDFALAMAAK